MIFMLLLGIANAIVAFISFTFYLESKSIFNLVCGNFNTAAAIIAASQISLSMI